jgi:hypothetical protein
MGGVTFELVQDDEKVLGALNEIFGNVFDIDFVTWLGDCPTGANRWYCAMDGNRIVGTYGLLPLTVQVDQDRYTGALCNNVGTVPEYRGRGIFTDLGRYALEDMEAAVNIGVPNEAAVPGHKKVGWANYGKLLLMGGKIEGSIQYLAMDLEEILEKKGAGIRRHFSVVRTTEFSKWRYSKPGQSYRGVYFGVGQYAVWKRFGDRKQVMETNTDEVVLLLGGKTDVWCFEGTRTCAWFEDRGFKPRLERDFILYTDLPIEYRPDDFRFEAADFDVF